jgi:epsilon-lactone hydrolase
MPNPQLQVVRQILSTQVNAAKGVDLAGMRAGFEQGAKLFPPLPGVFHEAVDTGGVRAEWIRPEGAEQGRAILYLHGGGFMLGSIDSYRDLAGRIALAAAAPVLSIDYRLAPEHPFPAGLDDAVHAYRWLIDDAGLASHRLALVGDSAGGGLALAAALRVRDAELPRPGAIACISPWADLTCSSASLVEADDPSMEEPYVRMMAMAYLAGQDPLTTPCASPLHADLRGLPPTLIQAGAAEALRDDAERFAQRCREADVDVALELWDEMIHAFHFWAPMLDDGQRAIEQLGAFVRSKTA